MKTVRTVDREDIENFIRFCQIPPKDWVANKMVSRFIELDGVKKANDEWRPFVAKIAKHQSKKTSTKPRKISWIFPEDLQNNLIHWFY